MSAAKVLDCNVPQGSVLGPGFFVDYDSPVGDIFRRHGVLYHLYADDTQVYMAFQPGINEVEAKFLLEKCIDEVRGWMAINVLKLNDAKTDFIVLGSKHQLRKVKTESIKVGDADILQNSTVKNIGATFDSTLNLHEQIVKTCKSAWFNLYQISKLQKFINLDQQKTAVHAFVTSRLDQNNALLAGLPKIAIKKLKHVQNAAARMLMGACKYQEATPLLQRLHWLPIEYRIIFKILLLAYKSLNDEGPVYLKELLIEYVPSRKLRSASEGLLVEPRTSSVYGDRAFSVIAPKLWNTLPNDIKDSSSVDIFKRSLKTYLFKKAFS